MLQLIRDSLRLFRFHKAVDDCGRQRRIFQFERLLRNEECRTLICEPRHGGFRRFAFCQAVRKLIFSSVMLEHQCVPHSLCFVNERSATVLDCFKHLRRVRLRADHLGDMFSVRGVVGLSRLALGLRKILTTAFILHSGVLLRVARGVERLRQLLLCLVTRRVRARSTSSKAGTPFAHTCLQRRAPLSLLCLQASPQRIRILLKF